MPTTLPNPKDVRDLFCDLLGRDVDVQTIGAWSPEPIDRVCVAEFVDNHLQLRAAVMLDLALSVFTGASIGLLPAGGAKDMVAERDPSEMVMSNLYEVLNILTSVFNTPDNPHVKIASMHAPGARLPTDVAQLAGRVSGRMDLKVDISGYGTGRLALLAA